MTPDSMPHRYLAETIGIPIKIISNDFTEFHGNEHQKVVFQIKEDEPDELLAEGLISEKQFRKYRQVHRERASKFEKIVNEYNDHC